LREPPRPRAGLIHLGATGRNRAGAAQRLQPEHHARPVFDQIPVGGGELRERGLGWAAVIDRAQPAAPEQLGQLIRIDLVALVAVAGPSPLIAHDDPIDERGHELVQPLRLGPFLKDDVHSAAHAAEELDERRRLRRHDGPRDHPSVFLPDRGHRHCLVDVQRDILGGPFRESRSLLWSTGLGRLHDSSKGRALNMR